MESDSIRPPDPSDPDPGSGSAPTAQRIDQVIETAEQAATEIRSAAEAQAQREFDAVRTQADTMTRERVAMVSELTEALLEHATLIASQCENLVLALESTMRRLGPASQDALLEAQDPAAGAIREGPAPPPPAPRAATWPPSETPPEDLPRNQPEAPQAGDEIHAGDQAEAEAGAESPDEPQPLPDAGEPIHELDADEAAHGDAGRAAERASGLAERQPETGDQASDDVYLSATRLALGGRSRSDIAEELEREFGIDDPDPVLDRVLGSE